MSDQQQLRQRREALAQAVNSHDKEAVLSFIHPTFVGKTKRGFSLAGYKTVVRMAEQLCAPGSDYQETVAIEDIEMSGDSARLLVRRVARAGSCSQEDRVQETWRLIDGRWLLVEERRRDAIIKPRPRMERLYGGLPLPGGLIRGRRDADRQRHCRPVT